MEYPKSSSHRLGVMPPLYIILYFGKIESKSFPWVKFLRILTDILSCTCPSQNFLNTQHKYWGKNLFKRNLEREKKNKKKTRDERKQKYKN